MKPKVSKELNWLWKAVHKSNCKDSRTAKTDRPVLQKAFVHNGEMAATDGFRVHILKGVEQEGGFYQIKDNKATKIEPPGIFPDYQMIIPKKTPIEVSLPKWALWQALQVAKVYSKQSRNIVKLLLQKDSLTIQASAIGIGECTSSLVDGGEVEGKIIRVKTQGAEKEGFHVGVNYQYLLDALAGWPNDAVVTLSFQTKTNPLTVTGKDGSKMAVIMPMHLF